MSSAAAAAPDERTMNNMSMRWYIVHAYSNFEKKVAEFDP